VKRAETGRPIVNKSHRVRHVLDIFALALFLLSVGPARADAVDDVLASQLHWRESHPITKARMRVIAGGGAPVGWYYLDLQSAHPTEVSIMSLLLGKSELVMRTVTDGSVGRIFLNEDVYLELDSADMSILGGSGFWAATDVPAARAALSGLYDIQGVATKTVDGITYTGIRMQLNPQRWGAFRSTVGPRLMANMVPNISPDLTVYFAFSGELHSVDMEVPDVNVEILFHDWTDLAASRMAELDDARRPPHAKQQRERLPVDEALIKYITKLTQ
jgi:hypothetical protein